jgi:hypothetical protein
MAPNVLLMCKIIAVAMLVQPHHRQFQTPFLPFIPGLDELLAPDVFLITLKTVYFVSAALLLLNRFPRLTAFTLGCCMLLAVVSSRTYYGNNKTFCGFVLVLSALCDPHFPPYLVRWQFSLVYIGAALNKLLDPDWQSGLFFEHWARERLRQPIYIAVSDWLPPLLAGKLMCWGTIAGEFFAGFGVFFTRLRAIALWTHVLFQVGLLEFTGDTFNLFFYAMQAVTLAFVTWPRERVVIWQRGEPFQVIDDGERYVGLYAYQRWLLFQPALWLGLTVLLACMPGALGRRVLVGGVVAVCGLAALLLRRKRH